MPVPGFPELIASARVLAVLPGLPISVSDARLPNAVFPVPVEQTDVVEVRKLNRPVLVQVPGTEPVGVAGRPTTVLLPVL